MARLIAEEVVVSFRRVDARCAGLASLERDGDVEVLQACVAMIRDREVVVGDAAVLQCNIDRLL